ncbi:MAG: alpha/beta hydrolase family protein [Terracidiphilus sp.]
MKSSIFLQLALVAFTAASIPALIRAQAPVAGDWQGTLSTSGIELRIGLHITAGKDGTLTATFDSIDQGAVGIPVTAIALKDSKLTFTVDAAHIAYEGTVNKDATEIDGTFTQGQAIPLKFKRAAAVAAPKPATPTQIDGTWLGTLDTGAIKLRVIFKIANTADGLTVQLQSPDQSPNWMPATSTTRNDNALTVTFKAIGAVYEGKIASDFNSIEGTFTQLGNPLPLNLKRVKDQSELEPRRPQNPVKPYPYREEDVAYKSAGNTLAATLTVPPGKGPFPAVLLIAGSGKHDRDESLLGHKPFLVLSDYLTRKGIVVLRADKRGVGKSTGDFDKATTADFAIDAEAGVAFLKTRSEVDPHKIGLIGHSEGGVVAPMAAVADPAVAFVVMMAGSAVPGDQIIVEQTRLISEAGGESKEKADADAEKERETLAVVKTEKDPATLQRLLGVKLAADGVPEAQLGAAIREITSPWFRFFINYDPATALRKLTCPVLALNGSLDLQVPPAQNLPPIRKALAEAGNQHAEVDELPGLNHLFQDAKTGSPAEYSQIEETMSPIALEKIASWILQQ